MGKVTTDRQGQALQRQLRQRPFAHREQGRRRRRPGCQEDRGQGSGEEGCGEEGRRQGLIRPTDRSKEKRGAWRRVFMHVLEPSPCPAQCSRAWARLYWISAGSSSAFPDFRRSARPAPAQVRQQRVDVDIVRSHRSPNPVGMTGRWPRTRHAWRAGHCRSHASRDPDGRVWRFSPCRASQPSSMAQTMAGTRGCVP